MKKTFFLLGDYPAYLSGMVSLQNKVTIAILFAFFIFVFIFFSVILAFCDKPKRGANAFLNFFKEILAIVFFPFVFCHYIIDNASKKSVKIVQATALFFLLPLWASTFLIGSMLTYLLLYSVGLAPANINTTGASMLPTVIENSQIPLKKFVRFPFFQSQVQKGDIVVFENKITIEELKKQKKGPGGFVKRVIGTAGDIVEIRDGYVYVNNQQLQENYILKPRSTFGGEKIADCQSITVAKGEVLVLGDNRKRSEDSRNIGLVPMKDIVYYLPFNEQTQYVKRWREKTAQPTQDHSSFLDTQQFMSFVNQQRGKIGLSPLRYDAKLALSAEKRAEAMLAYADFSAEGNKSGYSLKDSLQDANYENIIYAELPTTGYYDAQELFEYFFEFSEYRELLMKKDYQDIGISTFVGQLNGCPTQIVVQHLGGYVPPNYSKDLIENYQSTIETLKKAQTTWQFFKENPDFYALHKQVIDRMLVIFTTRITNLSAILERMQNNLWLTKAQQAYLKEDAQLNKEQELLTTQLEE